jgi:NTF2 fold immunity protein
MHLPLLALLLSFAALESAAQTSPEHSYKPAAGYVPNAATAIKIAVAVWEPIYGKEEVQRQSPFTARLVEQVWVVEGSLAPGSVGGVAIARIAKDDGRVLRVSHGK